MNGNICPKCGKPVMSYSRFIREAEPHKISQCGSCDAQLRRSPRVFQYLLIMLVLLAVLSIQLFLGMVAAKISFWIIWFVLLVWIVCWILLINYFSWRFIGWVSAAADTASQSSKINWKWVAIAFVFYLILYVLPLLAAFGIFSSFLAGPLADKFIGIWIFAGIIVISALVGYLSKGVTIREPAIAGCILFTFLLGYGAWEILSSHINHRITLFHLLLPMSIILLIVFFLSILGAWMGERAQKLWKPDKEIGTAL